MICFQIQKQKDGSELICPVVICDQCGEQITDASLGIVDGNLEAKLGATSGPLRTYHQGPCAPRLAPGVVNVRLDVVLDQLCNNSGLGPHPGRTVPTVEEIIYGRHA